MYSISSAGRAGQQHVVGGPAATLRRREHEAELLADAFLTDELVQVLRAQRSLGDPLLSPGIRGDDVVGRPVRRHAVVRGAHARLS